MRESRVQSRESRAGAGRCARDYQSCVLLTLFLLVVSSGMADEANLLQQRQSQQTARRLAVQMSTGVLDTQLRLLEENKLTALPLYGEIRELRGSIDQLVSNEMQRVLGLIVSLEAVGEPARRQGLQQARQLVRQIVVALLAERHKVRRRLQVSRTNALVRQLIEAQMSILETTQSLPTMPPARRDVQTIETLQDQRDTLAIYSQLVAALEDTSTWGGQLAADATASLEALELASVERHLQRAVTALTEAQFRTASESQRAVIEGLRALLRRMEASQGLGDAARDHALQLVGELIQEQQRVQGATRTEDLDADSSKDLLGGQQRAIEQQLGDLAEALPQTGTFPVLVAQARRASRGAEQSLFEADKVAALDQQDQVLAFLGRIQRQLQLAMPQQPKNSEQFDGQRLALEHLDQDLSELMNLQSEVTELSESDPAAAADKEQQVAEALANADQLDALPGAIQASLDETQQLVAEAQDALKDTAAQAASDRKQAAQEAENSLRELAAEVKASLDEMSSSQQTDQESEGQPSSEPSGESDSPAAQGGPDAKKRQEEESRSNQGAGQTAASQPTDSRAATSTADIKSNLRSIESEAWFVKLPPEVQQAVRASTRSRPPRGYEERLKRYFESID